ncbi:Uncharacterised protein [Mycobacteroides abscessus]|nr:Uncharacterised protein [Mycobacteroides abscessus]
MSKVPVPMIASVRTSVDLRPCLSPRRPKNMPPSGRARNPTANVPRDDSVATNEFSDGKKTAGKTIAAAVP